MRNRNMAINAIEGRAVEAWGEEVVRAVERAVAEEPCDDVRERLVGLVARITGRE